MNPNCTEKEDNQFALATSSTSLDVSWNLDAVGAPFNPNIPRLVSPLEPSIGFPFFFPANSQGWSQYTTSTTSKNTLHSVDKRLVFPSKHVLSGSFVTLGQPSTTQTKN